MAGVEARPPRTCAAGSADGAREQRIIADRHKYRFGNRARDQGGSVEAQLRPDGERIAESRQVARARIAERDPRHDALDIDRTAQQFGERTARIGRSAQRVDRVVARRGSRSVAQRMRQPFAQQAASGRCRAVIEQRQGVGAGCRSAR